MSEAVFRISTAGGEELRRTLGQVASMYRSTAQAINADARKSSRERRQIEHEEITQARRDLAGMQRDRQRFNRFVLQLERNAQRQRLRDLADRNTAEKKAAGEVEQLHRRAVAIEAALGRDRVRNAAREEQDIRRMTAALLVVRNRAEREATRVARTESRARAEAQRHADEVEESRRSNNQASRQRLGGAVRTAVGYGTQLLTQVGQFGDDVREKQRVQERLGFSATQIAAGDIGNASAAPQLLAATRRVSTETGQDPEQVMEALGHAQAKFSSLDTAEHRQSYLDRVLPLLARTALATGSTMSEMVDSAGELQRQLGITAEQLPNALAMVIEQGRLSSVAFKDMAGHMGAIGGAAGRFLGTTGTGSTESMLTANALFQTAGKGGGSGDEAATRTRAFLDNFTSQRGHRRLEGLVGHSVFDAQGQLRTREGETQSAGFQRVIEEAYAHAGGNSDRFLTSVAGVNTRSRQTGDQLFRDLRTHGGRLVDFNALVGGARGATAERVIDPAFNALQSTEYVQRSIQENRGFYGLTQDHGQFASQTDRQVRDFGARHPFIGGILNNQVMRGVLDIENQVANSNDPHNLLPHGGGRVPQGGLIGATRQLAATEYAGEHGVLARAFTPASVQSASIEQRAQSLAAEYAQRARIETRLSTETIAAIGKSVAEGIRANPITVSAADAAHARGVAATANPGGR
jgi:hypothetical protein